MTNTVRFGRKLNPPSTIQIKHQLLTFWWRQQIEKEAAEAAAATVPSTPHFDATAPKAPE